MLVDEISVVSHPSHCHNPQISAWEVDRVGVPTSSHLNTSLERMEQTISQRFGLKRQNSTNTQLYSAFVRINI